MRHVTVLFSLLLAALLAGCASAPPATPGAAPVDMSGPGWTVRQGQALWKPGRKDPEIAGDVVVSSDATGGSYVQFSKTLPIVSGRLTSKGWEFDAIAQQKRYSGGGKPPAKTIWLQMLRALEGNEVADRWTVAHPSDQYILLAHEHSGERLEVHFPPP